MANPSKNKGTAAETAITRTARTRGFPHADRLTQTGRHDRGDIQLTPNIIIEAKAGTAAETASQNQITQWLTETHTETKNHPTATIGFLVTKRRGTGHTNAHQWPAHFQHHTWATLMGYTLPPNTNPNETITTTLDSALALLKAHGHGHGTLGDVSKCPDAQEPPLQRPVVVEGPHVPVDVPVFVVGSLVRVGKGKKLWRVERLWADRPVASLVPVDGYTGTTVDVDRLVVVDEREVAA